MIQTKFQIECTGKTQNENFPWQRAFSWPGTFQKAFLVCPTFVTQVLQAKSIGHIENVSQKFDTVILNLCVKFGVILEAYKCVRGIFDGVRSPSSRAVL